MICRAEKSHRWLARCGQSCHKHWQSQNTPINLVSYRKRTKKLCSCSNSGGISVLFSTKTTVGRTTRPLSICPVSVEVPSPKPGMDFAQQNVPAAREPLVCRRFLANMEYVDEHHDSWQAKPIYWVPISAMRWMHLQQTTFWSDHFALTWSGVETRASQLDSMLVVQSCTVLSAQQMVEIQL